MDSLYLNEYSLGYLTQLILALVITLYLLSLRNKTRATLWLLLFSAVAGLRPCHERQLKLSVLLSICKKT